MRVVLNAVDELRDLYRPCEAVVLTSPSVRHIAERAVRPLTDWTLHWVEQGNAVPAAPVYLGVGSGSVMDSCKAAAHEFGSSAVLVPSVVSTDAAFSDVVAVRRHGSVTYDETGFADVVVIDPGVLAQTPWKLHARGLGDLMAVMSGVHDAQGGGRRVDASVRDLLDEVLDSGALMSTHDVHSALALAKLLAHKVLVGAAAREVGVEIEEGTEHHLAYYWEAKGLVTTLWHGDSLLAALGACAVLQDWEPSLVRRVRNVLVRSGLPGISAVRCDVETLADRMQEFTAFCVEHEHHNTVRERPVQRELAVAAARSALKGWS